MASSVATLTLSCWLTLGSLLVNRLNIVFSWCCNWAWFMWLSSMALLYPNRGIVVEFTIPLERFLGRPLEDRAVRARPVEVTGLSQMRHLAWMAAEESALLMFRSPTAEVIVFTIL